MHHLLAASNAGVIFALPIDTISRVVRWGADDHINELGIATVRGDPVRVVDADTWLPRTGPPPTKRRLVLRERSGRPSGVLLDQALTVFSCRPDEVRGAPHVRADARPRISGLCPWSKLADYLVRGAVHANDLAMTLVQANGRLRMDGHQLWAGSQLLNGNHSLVDRVQRETGYGCTIFAGNVRVATTATAALRTMRALGTRANEQITRETLGGGREFRGTTRTLGKDWAIVYRPLRGGNRVVGMLATFVEVSSRLFPIFDDVHA